MVGALLGWWGWPGARCKAQTGLLPVAGSGPGQSLMDEQTQRAPALPAAKVAARLPWISLCGSCSRAELFVLLRTIPGFGGGRRPTERAVTEQDVGPVPWSCGWRAGRGARQEAVPPAPLMARVPQHCRSSPLRRPHGETKAAQSTG